MKGQASAELLITVGVILAFTIPVILLMFTVSQLGYEDTTLAQADASARALAETVNFVYSQGPGATRVILLNTPPSTEDVSISGGEVVVRIRTSKGVYEATAPTFAKVDDTQVNCANVDCSKLKSGLFFVTVSSVVTGSNEEKVTVESVTQ